jgi:hypothetical protein
LGGWKAQGIPKGGFGHVLARKAKNGEKFLLAGRSGLTQESVSSRIFVRKKGMNNVQSNECSQQTLSAEGGKKKSQR